MKAYTITFLNRNYGSVLQAYALQRKLKELGADPCVLQKVSVHKKDSKLLSLFKAVRPEKNYSLYRRIRRITDIDKYTVKNEKIKSFIKNNINIKEFSDECTFLKTVTTDDFFIAGSDQIWNTLNNPLSDWYTFKWLTVPNKRFSYAASIGVDYLSEGQKTLFQEKLISFDTVSVRETSAYELLEHAVKARVRQDVDPTLLYDKPFWDGICSHYADSFDGYIFVYMLRYSPELIEKAKEIAYKKNLKVIYTGLYADKFKDVETVLDAGPEDFLSLVNNAAMVITNSFHGTVFSILYEKPFMSLAIASTSSRVESLLNMLNLESHLVKDVSMITGIEQFELDYSSVNKDLDHLRSISIDYLKEICGTKSPEETKRCYVGFNTNVNQSFKSSSGGAFSALASYFIQNLNGVVYGASMVFEDGLLQCKHIRIDNINELSRIQGTKYLRSNFNHVFSQIELDLQNGRKVLFSGTSCQIASIKNKINYSENLYTIDLVCHGVPLDSIKNDYISFIEKKYSGKLIDMSFRRKDITYNGKMMPYVMTFKILDSKGRTTEHYVVRPDSVFYAMFMSRAGYVKGCYSCKYASPDKPGDITLGDYRPTDTERRFFGLDEKKIYSTILANTKVGQQLLDSADEYLSLSEVPFKTLINHHHNLIHPSISSGIGERYYSKYQKGGFKLLRRYFLMSNYKEKCISLMRSVYRKTIRLIVSCLN